MCLASNIARRSGSAAYYARLGVPKDLQTILGKRELWESLRTKDAREARGRVAAVLARWHAEFADLRRRREATEADLQAVTWGHYQSEIEGHTAARRQLPTADEIAAAKQAARDEIEGSGLTAADGPLAPLSVAANVMVLSGQGELEREFRSRRKAELQKHVAQNETALVNDAARDVIRQNGFSIAEGSPAFRDLAQRLLRAELEGLRRAEEHDRGDYTGKPADPAVSQPRGLKAPVAAPGEGVLDLYTVFAAENPSGIKAETLKMNSEIIVWFSQHVGATFPASAIDKRAVREWKAALQRFPIKAAEVRDFRGLPFKKIIAENERLGRKTLSDRTVNKYLSALGAFCQWLMQNGHLENNPVDGMHLGEGKGQSKVRPYTPEQLTSIFGSPIFTGYLSDDQPHRVGAMQTRDHRFWLPLLSLFTGARMGELAQLLTTDVRQDRGRWIIHVTQEGDPTKVVKTKGSQRVIPVHPELERLGFIVFHAARQLAGDSRLFPEIEPDARGNLAGSYSRFFGRYVARIGVKEDASVNFHSFRHGMADALRRAGWRDEEFGFLLGHTKATTTGRYGILTEGDLAQRCKLIDAVAFPELSLSHLYPLVSVSRS
ncbi:site-specific integrase [Methylobacterium sp. 88A]|uniref:site-specific integrase n=1 Tax=Methylobacterium sp. 88A TaxID=1131813 RepID=UPI00036A1D5D|nr:site-specific integrase [Methylobacterium sp. 88A]